MKVPEKMVSVLEGHELILPCEADSAPMASFSWSKRQEDGKQGEKNQTLVSEMSGVEMKFGVEY